MYAQVDETICPWLQKQNGEHTQAIWLYDKIKDIKYVVMQDPFSAQFGTACKCPLCF